jgi:ankyrin repeat protein
MLKILALCFVLLINVLVAAGKDLSDSASLIDALYQASRQEKEKDATPFLEKARDLLGRNADVKGAGGNGRTALHWAVVGAMYAKNQKQVQQYVELTEQLISRGANVNAEDEFGATPLDYQENSPHTELLSLLLENGARNGKGRDETERVKTLLDSLSTASRSGLAQVRSELNFDLPIGSELQVRLTTEIDSNKSRAGDLVEAVVIAPAMVENRVVLPAGARIQGTVMLSQKPANDYERAQMILNFANLIHPDGSKTSVLTRLVDVDNAREMVQAGRIVGLAHPDSGKLTWGLRVLGVTDPILSSALQAAIYARDREYKRAIEYTAGAEMTLLVESPVRFPVTPHSSPQKPPQDASVAPSQAIIDLVQAQPLRTETSGQTPSDLTNLLMIGSKEQVEKAFQTAGWLEADGLSVKSGLKTFLAVTEAKGYKSGPISLLLLQGRKPDVVYQKQNNTFAKRHHIRIWKAGVQYQGADVWIAAATHDIGVVVHKEGREWTHRIDTQVDRERAKVADDLAFAGAVKSRTLVDRPAAPRQDKNATGDKIITDGKMQVLFLQ